MNDSLVKPIKPPIGGLKKGIAANRANYEYNIKQVDPKTVPNRLGIVIDDSGSMRTDGMENVHTGIKNFCDSCNALDTSIAVFPINASAKSLTCDYDLVTMYTNGIWATGGTEFYTKLSHLHRDEPITRAVLFSDGSPTDSHLLEGSNYAGYGSDDRSLAKNVVRLYVESKIPIDTIFIGQKDTPPHREMMKLAELTGGTCIVFGDTKLLSQALKYLAPKFRGLLANSDVKARIEKGEKI